MEQQQKFPSPYGVIQVLMKQMTHSHNKPPLKFPSPYGVIQVLIIYDEEDEEEE